MKLQTSDYKQFKFREDNREKGVNQNHVRALMDSIRACNMLELKPILVNEKMEVIDGQHRLTAAGLLNVPIWYEVQKDLRTKDLALLSINKAWSTRDFLNLYVKEGNEHYIKLKNFMEKHGLTLSTALSMAAGRESKSYKKFRSGEFEFNDNRTTDDLFLRKQSMDIIRQELGSKTWMNSSKYWNALGTLINHPLFDATKWFTNLKMLASRIGIKATMADYLKMFTKIYNFRNQQRIILNDDDVILE